MRNRTKHLLLLLGTFVFIDVVLRVFVLLGLVPYEHYPTLGGRPTYLDDIHPVVGVWHYPNATQRYQTVDFDIVQSSNSYGAQDIERSRVSDAPRRVVVLGDSYVEGFGVSREDRFTERLEALTGVEHLNFGSSGCFGSIQEWLLYDCLASTFDHSDVFVFMLPFNDYSDNDPRDFPDTRYRPYLQKTETGFEVTYPVAFEERGRVFYDWGQVFKNTIDNHWYLANLLRWTTRQIKQQRAARATPTEPAVVTENSYDRFTELDLQRLLYSYEQIVIKAGPRRVTFFTIPAANDYAWAMQQGYDFELVRQLSAFADRYPHVRYIDLLPLFMEHARHHGLEYVDYTHKHDGHWSAKGHAVVAELIQAAVFQAQDSVSGADAAVVTTVP
jgi:lysophospholipase L1-like esterase